MASLLVVVPGLIVGTLFALVGPFINLFDSLVPEAFRRSVRGGVAALRARVLFISLPLAIEHEVLVLVAELVPHEKIWLIFLTSFVLGDLFGMALGLIEVTLAERLVAGRARPGARRRRRRTWSSSVRSAWRRGRSRPGGMAGPAGAPA